MSEIKKWEVCLEHKSGVNWHVPADPPEGKCDAHRLLTYPGQTSNVVPCRIVHVDPPTDTVLDVG